MDQIPLAEISRVNEMEAADEHIAMAKDENKLMIETHPEGYNSGRTYYLQAESKVSCQDKIQRLKQYSAAAFERAHAQSVFRQAQLRVLKFYRSIPFQRFIAFLIISASYLNPGCNIVVYSDISFDRTLLSAYWMRSTGNKVPRQLMTLFA